MELAANAPLSTLRYLRTLDDNTTIRKRYSWLWIGDGRPCSNYSHSRRHGYTPTTVLLYLRLITGHSHIFDGRNCTIDIELKWLIPYPFSSYGRGRVDAWHELQPDCSTYEQLKLNGCFQSPTHLSPCCLQKHITGFRIYRHALNGSRCAIYIVLTSVSNSSKNELYARDWKVNWYEARHCVCFIPFNNTQKTANQPLAWLRC